MTQQTVNILIIVLQVLLLITSFVISYGIMKWMSDYKIVQITVAKLRDNVKEYDRLRREQMKIDVERANGPWSKGGKISFMSKVYRKIDMTGIPDKFTGFSELSILIIMGLILCIWFIVFTVNWDLFVGVIATGAFVLISWFILSTITYHRRISCESQLLPFANACSSASQQYSDIIDIFGAIYSQLEDPLRSAIEACYIEAKRSSDGSVGDKDIALKHLKDKFDSTQLAFVIDNFDLCSKATGDYRKAAQDVTGTIEIYQKSHDRKQAILRNAKATITAMFAASIAILFSLGGFLGDMQETLLQTTPGILSLVALGTIYFGGLSMRAEK